MAGTAFVLRHVHFEDLGVFEPVLESAGYAVRYHDVGVDGPFAVDPVAPDLVVALGGPIGVYETAAYPFLEAEIAFLRARLRAGRPTLGVCLGAQMMAAALGASVGPTSTKEIGFAPVTLTEVGEGGPLRHLAGVPVLHWHGDMFQIPEGGVRLAETEACANQAFAIGANVLGVQFHPEVDGTAGFERWLIGHAGELAAVGIHPRQLREDAGRHGAQVREAGQAMLVEWLGGLRP